MKARLLALLGALTACAHGAPEPALFSPQMASDRSVVVGRVLAVYPDSLGLGPAIVVVDTNDRPYRMRVTRLTGSGMQMYAGNRVTAWCRGVGPAMVADSVRVEAKQ